MLTDCRSAEKIARYEISMLQRYIHEGRLDEKQAIAFFAICSTFMVDFIKIYIQTVISIVLDNLVSNVSEIIGISETNANIEVFHHLRDKLIELGGDE